MKQRSPRDEYLDQALRALVAFVGLDAVKRALAALEAKSGGAARQGEPARRSHGSERPEPPTKAPLPKVVADLESSEPKRFEVLRPFFARVYDRELLRDSEDIRRFAELAGSKSLVGKSRRDLVAKLPPLLLVLPLDDLRALLAKAEGISGEERSQGYSILTEHLLRNTSSTKP
ncbi:MAG: hypothetical protein ABSC94_29270 [Polyangiaceae bacterium]|jgi:hypothetical protein